MTIKHGPTLQQSAAKPDSAAPAQQVTQHFPVVGLGGSAGALEAYKRFFLNVPNNSGMAYILVQHLDATHKSILDVVIRNHTAMKVQMAMDNAMIEPNHVYIAPANFNLSVIKNQLHFIDFNPEQIPHYPIDQCFRSLAQEYGDHAVSIVFSGTGSDGTLGLMAIKEAGGLVIAQTPDSAKYDSMPRSAIEKQIVDYVLSPEEMPKKLMGYFENRSHHLRQTTDKDAPLSSTSLQKIFVFLREKTGHDFYLYKQKTIMRRIEKRMALNQIANIDDYVQYLQTRPTEINFLFNELLIGVTRFFRDPEAFEILEKKALGPLLEQRSPSNHLRVWVPGCSTGEEPYTIAMLIHNYMAQHGQHCNVQIFATDIDEAALAVARTGIYPRSIAADVPREFMERYFTCDQHNYKIKNFIREMIVFSVQSLIKDLPFSRLDLISCRNLMIYLGPELQKKILATFHYALNPNGFLLLGPSETVGQKTEFFSVADRKWKLFQPKRDTKLPHYLAHSQLQYPILPNNKSFHKTNTEEKKTKG